MSIIVKNLTTQKGETFETSAVLGTPGLLATVIGAQALAQKITNVAVVRADDALIDAHWEMYFEGAGVCVKIDLMESGYRILYGAAVRAGRDGEIMAFELTQQRTLNDLVVSVARVATNRGDWTGTAAYNCQDFVVAFMREIGMSVSDIYRYELRRAATKRQLISVTDCVTQQGQDYIRFRAAEAPILTPVPTMARGPD